MVAAAAAGGGAPPRVVVGALAIVHEDIVSLRDLLESKGGTVPDRLGRLGMLVGVELKRQFLERRFDFLLGCGSVQT